MVRVTRSSNRSSQEENVSPSPARNEGSQDGSGLKRKASAAAADGTPEKGSKRGRPSSRKATDANKEQKTIEETLGGDSGPIQEEAGKKAEGNGHANGAIEKGQSKSNDDMDVDNKNDSPANKAQDAKREGGDSNDEAKANVEDANKHAETSKSPKKGEGPKDENSANGEGAAASNGHNGDSSKMDYTGEVSKTADNSAPSLDGPGAIQSSQKRGESMPSNILEKGLIYFFIRPRVGMDQSETASVQDVARSYIVLRPMPNNAKLTEGAIEDLKNNRLLALPKKVLPRNHQDKFMTFVERAGVTVEELKEDFMKGSTYDTATTGVRHSPPVTPVGEGVYAITTTGRESHLAYMLTIPSEIGEVQKELGLADKGAFVLSLKNPEQKGPANASLPEGAKFSKEIMEEFRGLRWMPCQPKHLDYANAQLLLIGEAHGELGKAVQVDAKDEGKDAKETPTEELEKLEGEDEVRVEGLSGDDSIYEDLGISKKEFPKVPTTW